MQLKSSFLPNFEWLQLRRQSKKEKTSFMHLPSNMLLMKIQRLKALGALGSGM